MKCIIIISVWCLHAAGFAAYSWHDDWMGYMDAIGDAQPTEEQIMELGPVLRVGNNDRMTESQLAVYRRIQSLLVSTPGHAEYFAREIDRITDERLAGMNRNHSSQRAWLFGTLGHLPSVETVRVLGRFLDDERDLAAGWDVVEQGGPGPTNNPFLAVMALERLGLKNSPTPPPSYSNPFQGEPLIEVPPGPHPATDGSTVRERLPVWRKWIGQANNGIRKISFEGDPREYSLAEAPGGGVSGGEPRRRPRLRPAPPAPSAQAAPQALPASERGTSRPALPTLLAVAGILLAALAWYLLRRGKARLPTS